MRLLAADPDGPSQPCTQIFDDQNIQIDESAKVSAGADFAICADEVATLNGNIFGSASSGVWTIISGGDGTLDDPNNPATNYNPGATDQANGAMVTLRLTTNDPGTTCGIVYDETIVTVNQLPGSSFSGLSGPYQEDDPVVQLFGSPATGPLGTGVFSGVGIVGDTFDPTKADIGFNDITYTFTLASTGCTDFTTQTVLVNEVTTVDFTISGGFINPSEEIEICAGSGNMILQGLVNWKCPNIFLKFSTRDG